jgi:hypothetical protein
MEVRDSSEIRIIIYQITLQHIYKNTKRRANQLFAVHSPKMWHFLVFTN